VPESGDRPTDISFGLSPRINAVSRIQGDASFCVDLLTSRKVARKSSGRDTELATPVASLYKMFLSKWHKAERVDYPDRVIVLEDTQWPVGVLGLMAGK